MAEISPANRSVKLNNRILNRINETMNGSQSQLHSLLTSAANAVSSIMSSSTSNTASTSSAQISSSSSGTASPHLVINSGSSSSSSSSQHTPNTALTVQSSSNGIILPSNWSFNSAITTSIKLDKKMFDKVNKLAEKLLKYCQADQMRLINSPPYIIDILPDICQIFNTVYFVYENKLGQLNDNDYFCVLIQNCLAKFQELVDLFKLAGKRMYEEASAERQKLVKYTLTYSHILAEMKGMFPRDVYEGESFRVAKRDAADFWKANFGDRVIVSWREFELKLNRVHQISNEMEMKSLRETIQLTKSNYVSIFEFDIFTRLFQPWNNLLNNWKFLVTEHPGYSAFSTYDEVHKRLQKHINKPGSYLFRLSCTKLGQWAIGYVTQDHKILQTIPQSLIQALIDGQKQGLYVYPDGRDIKIDISSAIAIMSASRIQCSREQYEMYCDVGSSFQICKICSENNKDRKLEPCGHLICSTCLENWQELHSTPSCPFCRCEIKTFEPVIISPFESGSNRNSVSSSTTTSTKTPRRSQSTLSDDSVSTTCSNISNGKTSENLAKRKSTSKVSSKEKEEAACVAEKSRSESMRCESKPLSQQQRSLLTSLEQQKNDRLQSNMQAMSLNSLSQATTMTIGELNASPRFNDSDDSGYLKPSSLNSQLNSLQNSSLHLKSSTIADSETNISQSGAAIDKNSSIEDSSTSSSSIDTHQTTYSSTTTNSKYNVDILLASHERLGGAKPEREVLLPPPPIPSARTNLLSRNTTSTTSTSTTKMPPISNTSQISPPSTLSSQTSKSSVLTPPVLPPPPLPTNNSTQSSPGVSALMAAVSSNVTPIVTSDSSNNFKSSTVRLRIDSEKRFELAMGQLGADRVRAACALYLAGGSDVKLAKYILSSSGGS